MTGLIKFVKWVGCAVLIVWGISYCSDVNVRMRSAERQWSSELSTEDGGVYTASYCYVDLHKILLRLYRTKDNELLAERLYLDLGAPQLTWTKDELIYDTSDELVISLPPTFIDRLLAKLP